MEIEISNKIRIKNAPDSLKNILIEHLKVPNPKYQEAASMGYSTWGINPHIYNFSILPDDSFLIPRGCRVKLLNLIKTMGLSCEVKDNRTIFPFNFEIDSSHIKYRSYQYKAIVDLISDTPEGVLVSPGGSGKTIMGISLVPLLGQPTMWLTHTDRLAKQTLERADTFLPSLKDDDVGYIGASKWNIGKIFTVAMIQTLIRRPTELYKLRNKFGLVVLDECLVTGSKISMFDGSLKRIEEVSNEDTTTFGKISNKFDRLTDTIINLRGSWGDLKGTTTHVLPYIPYKYLKIDKHTNSYKKLYEKNVIYGIMKDIKPKDFLLLQENFCHTEKYSIGKKKSRLLALIACDGHIPKNLSCIQVGVIKDQSWFLNEMLSSTSYTNDKDNRVSNCERGDLIIRSYSKKIVKDMLEFIPSGKKSRTIKVPSIMMEANKSDIKEYLQVVFDTEGAVTDQITLTMAAHEFIYGIQFLLRKFGIVARVIPIKRNNYLRLSMAGYDAFLFWDRIKFSIYRKQRKLNKLMKKISKFRRTVNYKDIEYRCVQVINKEIINKQTKVYDFTTEQHLFLANGILSSNCHHCPATTFLDVICQLNPYYLYGLTATPYRRDKLEALMFQTLGERSVVIPIKEVEEAGGIIMPTVRYRAIGSKNITGVSIQTILKDYIVNNNKRNGIIVGDILKDAMNNNFCIVISDRKAHCEILYKLISTSWEKTGIATGNYSKKYVDEQVARFYNNEITVLVTTFSLLGEGFDVDFLNRAFIAMPFRAEGKAEQLIARVQRTAKGKTDAIVYDYVDTDVGMLRSQFYTTSGKDCRYRVYERLGVNIEPY